MEKYLLVNDQRVLDLSNDSLHTALIDIKVLTQFIKTVPQADFSTIRHRLRENIMRCNNLEELLTCTKDFNTFHNTIKTLHNVLNWNDELKDYVHDEETLGEM
jgi:hypothetical protein